VFGNIGVTTKRCGRDRIAPSDRVFQIQENVAILARLFGFNAYIRLGRIFTEEKRDACTIFGDERISSTGGAS
jgi:hypothetical protein